MRAVCSKSAYHARFITAAHVRQDWVVDRAGNFLDVVSTTETVHGPDPEQVWVCAVCGAQASVEG